MFDRRVVVTLAGAALTAVTLAPATAAVTAGAPASQTAQQHAHGGRPSTYTLPARSGIPEGVAVAGHRYYVTSYANGAVYRGSLDEPRARAFLPAGGDGRTQSTGIKATATRLVVAGGGTGLVSVYNRRSGARVAQFTNYPSAKRPTIINDVAIAPNGDAYVTDSIRPVLYRISAAQLANPKPGLQRLRVFTSFRGTAFRYTTGPGLAFLNANGLAVSPDGSTVVIGQSNSGRFFSLDVASKEVHRVNLHGVVVEVNDGLAFNGPRVLYAVSNTDQQIAKIRLDRSYNRGRVVSRTGDRDFLSPTTVAVAGHRLLVVNSQLNAGPQQPPWTVATVPLP